MDARLLLLPVALLLPAAVLPSSAADSIAEPLRRAAAEIKTASGELETIRTTSRGDSVTRSRFTIYSPGRVRLDLLTPDGNNQVSYLFEGDRYLVLRHLNHTGELVSRRDAAATVLAGAFPALLALVRPDALCDLDTLEADGRETSGGRSYRVYRAGPAAAEMPRLRLFVGESNLIEGVERTPAETPGAQANTRPPPRIVFWSRNLKLNGEDETRFSLDLPQGYTRFVPPPRRDYAEKLIPVGQAAPDFELPTPDGARLSLSGALQDKRPVLLNFWFYG